MTRPLRYIVLLAAIGVAHSAAGAASLSEQANAAWARRAESGQTERAIALWKEALAQNPHQPAIYISLAEASGRAYRHATSSNDKKHWAQTALDYGKQALQANPRNAQALTAYAEALGQYAQANKGIGSLRYVKEAVSSLQQATALDPHDAKAHMLLAEFYAKAPSSISVGDKKKALIEARLAVQNDPAHTINQLALAEALEANDEKKEAIAVYQRILNMPAPKDAIPETASNKDNARKALHAAGISTTNDGGSACTDSTQCESACVADSSVAAGIPASGSCAQTTQTNCLNTLKNGKAQGTPCTP